MKILARRSSRVTISISVSDLRSAYMKGTAKTGSVDTTSIGITYDGKPITKLVFCRYNVVEYWNGDNLFAKFQDKCGIDD